MPNPASARNPPLRLDGYRVLVVDDNEDARDLLRILLEARGAKVDAASSVQEALACMTTTPPDVILSDLTMPIEDGLDLIRRVRAMPAPCGGTPAVLLSAAVHEANWRGWLEAGFEALLAKPIDTTELLRTLADILFRIAPA
jgi:CheY-like chemotaxis protein